MNFARTLAETDEREAWDMYAAAVMPGAMATYCHDIPNDVELRVQLGARFADAMLEERRKRFGVRGG